MRKFLRYVTLAVMAMFAFSASAVSFTLQIEDPEVLTLTVDGTEQPLVAGDNAITISNAYAYMILTAKSPYRISSVTKADGTFICGAAQSWDVPYAGWSLTEGATYVVKVENLDDIRTGTFVLDVDDASLITLEMGGTNAYPELQNGVNNLKFIPGEEKYVRISAVDYGKPLYSVTANDVPVAGDSQFTVDLEEGMVIKVVAALPSIPVEVTMDYSEGAEGCFAEILEGETPVEVVDGKFSVTCGSKVLFKVNPEYLLDALSFDDNVQSVSQYTKEYEQMVIHPMTVKVEAHKLAQVPFTIEVNNPEYIDIYKGYSSDGTFDLKPGVNEVSVSELVYAITWKVKPHCFLTAVTINGEPFDFEHTYASVEVTEGMKMVFEVSQMDMSDVGVLWVDDMTPITGTTDWTSFYLADTNRENIVDAPQSGYTVFNFSAEGFNPMYLSWYYSGSSNGVNKVYLNGELQEATYGTNYELTLANNDVLRVYLVTEPKECNVTFDVADGISPVVYTDLVKEQPNYLDGVKALNGTQFNIVAKEGTDKVSVKVNDADVTPDSTGASIFTVDDDAVVKITKDEGNGIGMIDAEGAEAEYYNLQGVRVSNPENGVFIVRQGAKTYKVVK